MTNEERDTIIVNYLNTPAGRLRFAASFYRGVNQVLMIPDYEGKILIREFQEKYGTTRGLPTYLEEARLVWCLLEPHTIH
jgi:hypothetical protein